MTSKPSTSCINEIKAKEKQTQEDITSFQVGYEKVFFINQLISVIVRASTINPLVDLVNRQKKTRS